MTIIVGVDPGVSGAIAAIDHNGVLIDIRDLPTIALPGKGTVTRRLDGSKLVAIVRELVAADECAVAYVEDVHAWAGVGGASVIAAMVATKFVILAILDLFASRIRVVTVPPVVWKRSFDLKREKDPALKPHQVTARAKAASRAKAIALYPDAEIRLVSHDGRAEALLIAAYGRDREGFRDDLLAEPKAAPVLTEKQLRDARIDASVPW
jgi:hypothetical protein